ncbi:dethiobiotin synthase [Kluyveromyces lactis]|uniref:KLLA0B00407p n=1 Tax=Kluyveromyces lactis (strain ATCC 8585 / CBS 2359 / DSM 70799 / NBRC 1267 / NRRL Y-1140 / WM37) TaxID=284590 RepID=Q6CWZ1_KLULA|nr:uncharacterized protein KLLA0_B00407g [Kluyveromyces lactis]CAH01941.1 KLLA0B00407p [Kluyveromyces lactis]|eukprot:XP_451548.1 uncharacterized protein KLLA0_B00407g [Kluyveromyces lactis]
MAKIIFVTGTGTDVGKTFISALLVHRLKADYWKAVQTGLECDTGDTRTISKFPTELTGWKPKLFPPRFQFKRPLSPYNAMEFESEVDIKLSDFCIPSADDLQNDVLIVEGAGGLFVPITKKLEITTDLIQNMIVRYPQHEIAIVVVADSGLGTLNHTMLTVEHLNNHGLGENFSGCILNGPINAINAKTLRSFGVNILSEIERCETNQDLNRALNKMPDVHALYVHNK